MSTLHYSCAVLSIQMCHAVCRTATFSDVSPLQYNCTVFSINNITLSKYFKYEHINVQLYNTLYSDVSCCLQHFSVKVYYSTIVQCSLSINIKLSKHFQYKCITVQLCSTQYSDVCKYIIVQLYSTGYSDVPCCPEEL